jgi:hypothetical protein
MAQLDRVEIDFLAKDLASSTIQRIDKSITTMTKNVETNNKKTSDGFSAISRIMDVTLGVSLANLGTKFVEFGTKQVQVAISQAIKFEQQMLSLDVQTSNSAKSIVSALREATDGTVSQLALAQGASRALALGINRDALPALARVSIALGKIQGITADQAFNDIVTGIGRASPLILDNLGIVIDSEKVYGEYAESIGKSVIELSKLERTTAITNAVIENSEAITLAMSAQFETTAERIAKFQTAWSDLLTEMGGRFVNVFSEYMSIVDGLPNAMLRNSEAFQIASNNAKFFSDNILQLTESNKKYYDELKGIRADIDSFLGGGQLEIEAEKQRELNKEKLVELNLKKEIAELAAQPFAPTAVGEQSLSSQIANKERELELNLLNQQAIRDESELIRAEKLVLLDEAAKKVEESGESQSKYLAKDIDDLQTKVGQLDPQIVRMQEIEKIMLDNSALIEIDKTNVANTLETQKEITEQLREQHRIRSEMITGGDGSLPFMRGNSATDYGD